MLRLADDIAATGRDPDVDALLDASVPLVALQARELGLVDRTSRLRELRIAAAIAATNMAAYAGDDQDTACSPTTRPSPDGSTASLTAISPS